MKAYPNENKTPYAGVPTSTDSGAWEFRPSSGFVQPRDMEAP